MDEQTTMKLIVGLGNPGDQYEDTRHNIGFMVLNKLAHELGSADVSWTFEKKHNAQVLKTGDVVLVKPQTLMNASGVAVKSLATFYKLSVHDIIVVHDDLDLPLGKIRIRTGGASAGHHGIDSVMKEIGNDGFVRVRLGIGRDTPHKGIVADRTRHQSAIVKFVLSKFTLSEAGSLRKLIKYGVEAVRMLLTDGIDKAMNRFN